MSNRPEFQSEAFKKGVEVRRKVLGDAYVDKSLNSATDFTAPMQVLATEGAWNAIWTRPGLEHRERSMIVVAMLTATAKSSELKVHIRGAIRNGVTLQELQEIILQAAVYSGMPNGLEGMRCLTEVVETMEKGGEIPESAKVRK